MSLRRLLLLPLPALLLLASLAPAQRFEDEELYAPNPQAYNQFGSAVGLSVDYALVGISRDDALGTDAGAAWLFAIRAGVSPPQRQLFASDGSMGDFFGCAVDIDGDFLVAGARSADSPHVDSGAAYVFSRDLVLGDWVEVSKLDPLVSVAGDQTGAAAAISGGLVAVGAPGDDTSGIDSGIAYAYRQDPVSGAWNYEGWLLPNDGEAGDSFGEALDCDGDLVAVGAWGDDDLGSASGSVYLFRYVSGFQFWQLEAKLTASDGAAGDLFGWSVSVDGDVVVVGAPSDDDLGTRSGAVYSFRYDLGTRVWSEEQKLLPLGGLADDQFGRSVAVSGDELLVGSPGAPEGAAGHGRATWFRRAPGSGQWVEQAVLVDSSPQVTEQAGEHVALLGDRALVAAPNDRDKGQSSGSASLFHKLAFRIFPQPNPPVAGQPVVVDVLEGEPGAATWMAYSTTGLGSYPILPLGIELNLDQPRQAGPMRYADPAGNVQWVFQIPPHLAGVSVWAQALQADRKTAVLPLLIQ